MKKKVAFITGITGQDGSLLAKFLLKKDYAVHGLKRRASSFNTGRIDSIYEEHQLKNKSLILHYGDLTDSLSMYDLLNRIKPDEIYNLGAQSHVAISFINPEYTTNVDGMREIIREELEKVIDQYIDKRLLNEEIQVKVGKTIFSGNLRPLPKKKVRKK